MKRISEITKKCIFELFRDGYDEYNWLSDSEKIIYYYYGSISEIDFLKRLYPLEDMPSTDQKYDNAADDIWQHTVNNPNDWSHCWTFEDERFLLKNGSDEDMLRFLCEVFHPAVRYEKGYWKDYLGKINTLLKADGYELYESDKISNRYVYSWRQISEEESISGRFMPFSVRYKKAIEDRTISIPTISKKIRRELISLFNQYEETQNRTIDGGYNYSIDSKGAVIEDLKDYYVPKAFDSARNYSETTDLEHFVISNHPYCVFDAIELFARLNNHNNFADGVNHIFLNNSLPFKLLGGKIEPSKGKVEVSQPIKEEGLKELVEHALSLYNNKGFENKQLAVEKLWDAFERLKTYYTDLNKKTSAEKVISDMSIDNEYFKELFNEEFRKLTDIGNKFRIRHHETDKIDIIDNKYYDYFFHRCFSLIDLALKYLN